MFPAERGDMLQEFVGNGAALLAQMGRNPAEIDGVPMDDGSDDKIESRRSECLAVIGAIMDFATLVEEDSALELVGTSRQTIIRVRDECSCSVLS